MIYIKSKKYNNLFYKRIKKLKIIKEVIYIDFKIITNLFYITIRNINNKSANIKDLLSLLKRINLTISIIKIYLKNIRIISESKIK